jgi:Flp pilus assembly pilin Flp
MMLEGYTFLGVTAGALRRRAHKWLVDQMGSEEGATAAEYAVLIAVIAAVIFAGAAVLGTNVNTKLDDMGTDIGSF